MVKQALDFIRGSVRPFVISVQTVVTAYAVLNQITLPTEWWAAYGGGLAWYWVDRSQMARLRKGETPTE